MKKIIASLLATVMVFALLPTGLFDITAKAATSGYYTYSVSNGEATITDCSTSISGSVTIPSTLGGYPVTSIGNSAFENCDGLTSVTIPDSVTSIGSSAFKYCDGLTSVTIPYSVTSIGYRAFYDCERLTSITIPDSVTSIGDEAFVLCNNITSITIPNSVTSIGSSAFEYCSSLTSITIPDSVTSIGYRAFYDCESLTSITIPDSVTSIGHCAFYDCERLTSITIPDSVTSIGYEAFSSTAYYENSSNWQDNVLYIGNHLIDVETSISGSYEIKEGTKTIAGGAFEYCSSLTSITIPDSVTSIGYRAFYDCERLTSITIPDSVTSIGERAFSRCSKLTNINIPNSVTSIGNYVFESCSSLTSVTIGKGVTSIGSNAFYECSSLASVHITDILAWCNIDFAGYESNPVYYAKKLYLNGKLVTDLVIPNGVTSIGSYAFYNCDGLTSITIPDSVTSIGGSAFSSCSSLTSITIPNSVTSIGSSAFKYCSSLAKMTIPFVGNTLNGTNNTHFGYIFGALSYNENADYVYNDDYVPASLKEVVITKATSIRSCAFYNCSSLTSITIPDSVTSIGSNAFYGCSSLTSVHITDILAWCNIDFAGYESNPVYYAKKLYLNGKLVTDLVIPNGVTSIGSYAFYNCDGLTSITIPDSVTSIGGSAFSSCSSLTSITIPNSVTSIGSSAFKYCSSLAKMTIPFVGNTLNGTNNTHFGYIFGASKYETNKTHVPKSLKTVVINGGNLIDDYAFYDCSDIEEIIIVKDVRQIGFAAFQNCAGLKAAYIPKFVTQVGYYNYVFYRCAQVTVYGSKDSAIYDNAQNYGVPFVAAGSYKDRFGEVYGSTPGDLTGDGKINSLDGLMLLRYLNGWNINVAVPDAMDVNGDGKVNSLDGLMLLRYLNGWNIQLG